MLNKLKSKSSVVLFLVIILLFISFILFNQRKQDTQSIDDLNLEFEIANESDLDIEKNDVPDVIIVDVKGEINQPGIYEVKSDMRVNDVINLAGGLNKNADESQLNLAAKVADEMIIQVPSINQEVNELSTNMTASNPDKIKLNQATVDDLITLTGIGPSKAEAILAYRDDVGMFKDVEDLLNVSGIGEKTLDAIRDEIQAP